MNRLFGVALTCVPLLFAPLSVKAQTAWQPNARVCSDLEGQLASLQRSGNSRSSKNYEKYDAAVHKQLAQIDSANRRAKQDACFGGGGFLFRRTPKPTCPALLQRIDKMKRNLTQLEKKRNGYTPPAQNSGAAKAQLLAQLARANCGDQYERFAQPQPRTRQRRSLFGALFGADNDFRVREYNFPNSEIPQIGTYRTVCVRACDGFFFPISFSTTENSFSRDAGVCQNSCPGSDAELYVYRNPGESTDDMVSLSGRPYKALETAYLYKKEYVQGCACQKPVSQLQAITTSDQPQTLVPQDILKADIEPDSDAHIMPLPMPKQAASIDPDTRALQRLGMTFEPYRPPEISADSKSIRTADGRSIRIVGPRFFGTQE